MNFKLSMHSAAILALVLPVGLAAPRKPQHDSEIVERLPRGLRSIARSKNPSLAAARQHILLAQMHGDPRYARVAENMLQRLESSSVEARFLRGVISQHLHRFSEAESAFQEVLREEPAHAEAMLQLAALHVLQGRFKSARESLARNPQLLGSARGLGLLSVAASLSGQLDASIALLRRKAASFEGPGKAWLKATLAEMEMRRGNLGEAEALLIEARSLQPESIPLLVQWADLLLEQRRFAEVAALPQSELAHTGVLLRAAIGMARSPGRRRTLQPLRDELQARLFDSAEARHLREQALFALHVASDPKRALAIALENFREQREPIDARVALEAALRANDAAAAEPVLAWLKESRLEDAALAKLAEQFKEKR